MSRGTLLVMITVLFCTGGCAVSPHLERNSREQFPVEIRSPFRDGLHELARRVAESGKARPSKVFIDSLETTIVTKSLAWRARESVAAAASQFAVSNGLEFLTVYPQTSDFFLQGGLYDFSDSYYADGRSLGTSIAARSGRTQIDSPGMFSWGRQIGRIGGSLYLVDSRVGALVPGVESTATIDFYTVNNQAGIGIMVDASGLNAKYRVQASFSPSFASRCLMEFMFLDLLSKYYGFSTGEILSAIDAPRTFENEIRRFSSPEEKRAAVGQALTNIFREKAQPVAAPAGEAAGGRRRAPVFDPARDYQPAARQWGVIR